MSRATKILQVVEMFKPGHHTAYKTDTYEGHEYTVKIYKNEDLAHQIRQFAKAHEQRVTMFPFTDEYNVLHIITNKSEISESDFDEYIEGATGITIKVGRR